MIDLSGRVIVITGAGGGIGEGIARRFSAAGATLVLSTRTSPVAELADKQTVVQVDLNEATAPALIIEAALGTFGRIDGLINNAGIQPLASTLEVTDDDFRQMLETDVTAVHRLTQAVARQMVEQGAGGSIVHIASIEGVQPAPLHGHYATAKAALRMHARAAAQEFGRHQIRVNTVSPGLIDRPGLEQDWPQGVQRWLASAPLGRLGTADEVGDACVFLCSDLARFITGADLVVDGGVLTRPTW
ncbi:MAG TPA: SDR family oxidoreductase [Acidimicrobiia bacterium]|jgi:NAD(P)-dependent dehydrogenase (short-subunit alcohol dehydrogenase family)